jgi:hypothetical protein
MHNRIFLHARVVCSTELGVASRARTFQPSDLRLAHSIRLGRVPRTECVSRSVLSACAYNDAKDALSHRRTASVISPTSPRDEVAAMCEASKVAEENIDAFARWRDVDRFHSSYPAFLLRRVALLPSYGNTPHELGARARRLR